MGVNWGSILVQNGLTHARRRLWGKSGTLNHDLQSALERALQEAIKDLEAEWWTLHPLPWWRFGRPGTEADKRAKEIFTFLREDARRVLAATNRNDLRENELVLRLVDKGENAARDALASMVAAYVEGLEGDHDHRLVEHLTKALPMQLALRFGEELKQDRPDSNRAWRAFQRLSLEGLQSSLDDMGKKIGEVQAEQAKIKEIADYLEAWAKRMEGLPPE